MSICIYVDVDETIVRNYGRKRIPMPNVIEHIKELNEQGATLYCWSSGGADYARESAAEFGIEYCFTGFLPKPQVVIDDQQFNSWRNLIEIHPNECADNTIDAYKEKIMSKVHT
ncbi:DUF705 domain-containing protein [Marinobacter sediminicola]|uniref:DUF705 domain-containing protein n=1 Tax=Marinobacter sediminicola TaxID=3072994 RepID=UPI00281271A5|nr:DUF705 domain-containing protein [Marinobacter sp. F26243]